MRGNAAVNEIRETDGETKLLNNEQRKKGGEWMWRLLRAGKIYLQACVHVYLSDEDTGNAFWIVSFGVGRSKQLLTFPLLKAMQEGWIQDVLKHLWNSKTTSSTDFAHFKKHTHFPTYLGEYATFTPSGFQKLQWMISLMAHLQEMISKITNQWNRLVWSFKSCIKEKCAHSQLYMAHN